jgi:DNA polymerase III subunit delta'
MQVYPWQTSMLERLTSHRQRLHHALLLRGPQGTGKYHFGMALAKALLCETPDQSGAACGKCPGCGWFEQSNHPDFRLLTPEQDDEEDASASVTKKRSKASTQIVVNQVRALQHFLELSSHHSAGSRVVLVHPAEALNAAAANALLKVLEEPPANMFFILVSHQPRRLLPTILSRCQAVDMPMPEQQEAVSWLEQQGVSDPAASLAFEGGAPLAVLNGQDRHVYARRLAGQLASGAGLDPYGLASSALEYSMETALEVMQKWIYDLFSYRMLQKVRYHHDHLLALQGLSKSVDLGRLLDYQRKLDEMKKNANHPLNHELQLESLLLTYTQLFQ